MTQPKHEVQPPPNEDPTVSAAARILEVAVGYEAATAALAVLLAPFKLNLDAIAALVRLTGGQGTNHTPRPRGYHAIARAAAADELYYRAAYLIRAVKRVSAGMDDGASLREAMQRERVYWLMHEKQRRVRQEAVKRDLANAQAYGPILGWYLNPLLNNEAECIAANGHNYDALAGTVIGRPGTVHAGCGCKSGPPIEGAGWVDDAVADHITFKPRAKKRRRAA